MSKLRYRGTADMLNRTLHRDECNSIKTSTLEDWVESYGESLSDGYMSKAEEILDSYNVDEQSGIIAENASLSLPILNPELPVVIEEKRPRHFITEYNRGRDRMEKLKFNRNRSYYFSKVCRHNVVCLLISLYPTWHFVKNATKW